LDTPSLIGSMAKQFVAMAVMILAEQGSLSFDDPLTKFFPEFSLPGQKITIRHLLNHTSGLPEFEGLLHNRMKVDFVTGMKGHIEVTAKDVITAYAQLKEARFKPGEQYEYNNGGYVVLSHVVEKASGKSFSNPGSTLRGHCLIEQWAI
jgi:CubicO group peptidase (beta-lactamase class C family)